jgi:hypothetical protein
MRLGEKQPMVLAKGHGAEQEDTVASGTKQVLVE